MYAVKSLYTTTSVYIYCEDDTLEKAPGIALHSSTMVAQVTTVWYYTGN